MGEQTVSFYKKYLSQNEYDHIVSQDYTDDPDTFPHCNTTMFHEPGVCAFCDGYFRRHPDFHPVNYVTREANGWGGNQAPIVDDALAAREEAEWKQFQEEFLDGTYEAKEQGRVDLLVERIVSRFRKKK